MFLLFFFDSSHLLGFCGTEINEVTLEHIAEKSLGKKVEFAAMYKPKAKRGKTWRENVAGKAKEKNRINLYVPNAKC